MTTPVPSAFQTMVDNIKTQLVAAAEADILPPVESELSNIAANPSAVITNTLDVVALQAQLAAAGTKFAADAVGIVSSNLKTYLATIAATAAAPAAPAAPATAPAA